MQECYAARPWPDVRSELKAAGMSYTMRETKSPRDFFKVDEAQRYVVRARISAGAAEIITASAPMRSESVAGDDGMRR